jgi:hypothetical protein
MRGALGACAAILARSVVKPAGILPSLQQASQHVRRDRFPNYPSQTPHSSLRALQTTCILTRVPTGVVSEHIPC